MIGHGRRSRKVITGGLESVLVGHPVDGDDDSFGGGVGVRSAGHGANILRLGSDFLLSSALLDFDAVGRFKAKFRQFK